ncbi:MAG: undecaprenyl diphosphate synthase family protein [Nanoarchaeota archaeon]
MVLDTLLPAKRLKEIDENGESLKHVALQLSDIFPLVQLFQEKGDDAEAQIDSALVRRNELIVGLLELQIKHKVPIMTLHLTTKEKPIFINRIYERITGLLLTLAEDQRVQTYSIRVSIIGKWYDIPSQATAACKKILEKTKTHEQYFLNLCINYDGQEEILDAARLIAHKVLMGKVQLRDISTDDLRENLYLSTFSVPDRVVLLTKRRRLLSFLLWEAAYAKIYFDKHWSEMQIRDTERYFQR